MDNEDALTKLRSLPQDWQNTIHQKIHEPEQIAWIGQSGRARPVQDGWPIFIFGAIFMGVSLHLLRQFWHGGFIDLNTHQPTKTLPVVMIIVFMLIGIFSASLPFLAARASRKTVYLITDQRVFIFGFWPWKTVRSWRSMQLCKVERTVHEDGTATLLFAREWSTSSMSNQMQPKVFYRIENPDKPQALMTELIAKGYAELQEKKVIHL